MKCFFQIVHKNSGARSPAISMSRTEFARKIRQLVPDHELDENYILVLVENLENEDSSEWDFSRAPLMLARTFVTNFGASNDE